MSNLPGGVPLYYDTMIRHSSPFKKKIDFLYAQ